MSRGSSIGVISRWSNKKVNTVQEEPILDMGVARKKMTPIFCAKTIISSIVCHEVIDANQGNGDEI